MGVGGKLAKGAPLKGPQMPGPSDLSEAINLEHCSLKELKKYASQIVVEANTDNVEDKEELLKILRTNSL